MEYLIHNGQNGPHTGFFHAKVGITQLLLCFEGLLIRLTEAASITVITHKATARLYTPW
jgi:hypothetical protein